MMLKLTKQSGFSLLEVMIAVMVLAIGLLGMAAMQAVALSSNQEAQFRVQALAIAEDLSSRMRTNRAYVNASKNKYPLIPADHAEFNVYSDLVGWDYNASPADPVAPSTTLPCGDPLGAGVTSTTALAATLNCRAMADVQDIRRQLNPDDPGLTAPSTGRLLPAGSLMFVDCADKTNIDYTLVEDGDSCSPGSVYTIHVLWPVSAGRTDAGQTEDVAGATVNRLNMNARCVTRLATHDASLSPRNYGCVIMDIVP